MWVVQELRLGYRHAILQCGHDTISLHDFRRAIVSLISNIARLALSPLGLSHAHDLVSDEQAMSTVTLLALSRFRGCSRAQDKVYGALSVAPSRFASRISPDYGKSAKEVYRDALMAELDVTARLDLLALCETTEGHTSDRSWVPDLWNVPECYRPMTAYYQAAGPSQAVCRIVDPRVLEVTGVKVGVICSISEAIPNNISIAAKILSGCRLENSPNVVYPTGQRTTEAYLELLQLGEVQERFVGFEQYSTLQGLEQALSRSSEDMTLVDDEHLLYSRLSEYAGSAFVRTTEGYFGLGPSCAKPGKLSHTG